MINTIRIYLEKFAILYAGADVSGTSAMIEINKNYYSTLFNLLNNSSWSQAEKLSQGTKNSDYKNADIFNKIVFKKCIYEIENIDLILILLNQLNLKLETIRDRIIFLLIK